MCRVSMLLFLLCGCGPAIDDAEGLGGGEGTGGSSGGSTGEAEPEDESSTGAAEGESSTGAEPTPEMLPGLLIDDVRHGYECIDGCESFYSSESLSLTLTSQTARTIELELQDWTLKDRELSSDEDPIMAETVTLPAGEATEVRLRDDRTGFCSFEDWSGPVRVRLHVDGAPVEVEGHSGAGYGWDC